MMSSSSHHQQSPWGGADGIAYIQTTPLLQGKPVTPQSTQIKSPFMSADVQAQPLASVVDRQHQQHQQQLPYPAHLQAQQQQAAHHASQQNVLSRRASSSSKLHQLPIIVEQASNASISPTHTCTDDDDDDDDAISQTTSSYSSPSASTAANASSSDLRAYSQVLGEQPHQLHPSCSFQMSAGHQNSPGTAQLGPPGQQPAEIRDNRVGTGGLNKSRFRGVSYDKKKRKWRVQIKVATLGKSGVSVGYYDTEMNAARAYDRAAIGLLGRDNCSITTNFPLRDYDQEVVPQLIGKTREEVKATLKNERAKVPRRRFSSRQRTSRFMGVGSSNRKNQWQARILVHGKVTHLGYYETEEDAARVYDRVSISLHGAAAQTNFALHDYQLDNPAEYSGLDREDLQRALGVKPMDKSSKFRGVSKKKGKWEAKVMVNRKWAYRELFDSEEEAARAYDGAVWRLKPKEAKSYVNFKERPGQGSTKLAKAARAIERAHAKERVGSSQNSPSSCRSLPPLPPAHDSHTDGNSGHSFAPAQQQTPLPGFPVSVKQEPQSAGAGFSPHMYLSQAAQSAAVANLGAAPPASSPGSLSRTSSLHVIPAGLPQGQMGSVPTWLQQPFTAALPHPRPFQPDAAHFSSPARSFSMRHSQQLAMPALPAGLMQQHSMMRTLSEADISNQSAMSASDTNTTHQHGLPPLGSARQLFHMHTMPGAQSPRYPPPSPMSPQKLRSCMSYQELSSHMPKFESPPSLQSSINYLPPQLLQPQFQQQHQSQHQAQHQSQAGGQQQQSGSMMFRVGSESHLIPESNTGFFGMPRVPSAPYMQLDQRSSQTAGPHFMQELPLSRTEGGAGGARGVASGDCPFGQWAPDSQQVLGSGNNEIADMQVDSPAQPPLQQPSADVEDPDNPNFGMPFMNSQPHPFPMQPRCSSSASPQMQQPPDPQMPQQGSFSPQLQSPQMPFPLLQPSHSQQQMPSMASQLNRQQHEQLQQQQQQQQQHIERLEHQIHLQQSRQQQMQHMQQQGSGQRHGLPRSASVNHLGMSMQWQPSQGNIGPRCASTSNLMLPGQEWMHQQDIQGGYGSTSMQHNTSSAGPADFDPSPGQHFSNAQQMSADFLADLSASQLLAQADLTECNSPLKIVQIGGDDLFETDEAAGNEYLLDAESGLAPQG